MKSQLIVQPIRPYGAWASRSICLHSHLFLLTQNDAASPVFCEHPKVAPASGPLYNSPLFLEPSSQDHGSVAFSLLVSPGIFSARPSLTTLSRETPPLCLSLPIALPCYLCPIAPFCQPEITCIVCSLVHCLFSTLEYKFWDYFFVPAKFSGLTSVCIHSTW